jgi:four helix bundle protein
MAGSYKDLVAWRKAMGLAVQIYRSSESFPKHELYGLTSQIRRASVSVPSNIAEGQARYSRREFHHFLNNARGSLAEVKTQIVLARELAYLAPKEADTLLIRAAEVGRILNGLIASTKTAA